uniref:Uncharacterized protein n=1 Tax=Avena sativa TaxID=4498 RepID=A0ACD5VDN6_AVESA
MAAAFSIRGFAASKRGEQAAAGRRPLGIKDLPPIEAPKFRWWEDELASAVSAAAAAPSPRRSPKAKPPKKKRSISDLFAAAPPLPVPPSDESGGDEQTEVEDDEALLAIVKRAKEEKKRRRRQQEEGGDEEQEAAAAADGCVGREAEGNFETTKEAPENLNLPDGLDTQPSQKPEASQHLRKEMEHISRRRKQGKIKNSKKKADKLKRIDNNKADKVGKPRDLEKHLPRQSILKCIERTSVKMVKEKHVNSEGKEVIELSRKSVKRVKFSEADDILGSEMQGCELPKRRSLSKLFSDAMASSSSSSYSSTSTEGEKCIPAESSSSHMPKEAFIKTKEANLNSNHEDSPTEGDKCVTAESCSPMPKEAFTKTKETNLNHEDYPTEGDKGITAESCSSHMTKEAFTKTKGANVNSNHGDSPTEGDQSITRESSSSRMPKEACTKAKEANLNLNHEDPPEPSNTELSSHLLDLNTLPESTDLNYMYHSNSEVPYLEHAHKENLNSDVQLLVRRENRRNLSFDSHRLASQLPVTDSESVKNARWAGTLLQGELVKVSEVDIVCPPLSARELGETHLDCSNVSVKDTMITSTSTCALPGHTFQDSFQDHQNGFHTNLNHGGSQLSNSGKFPSLPSPELNLQRDCSPSVGQTFRLMGKSFAVCTERGETSAETRQKHTVTSTNDYGKTNAVLELPRQGQPFLSLQAQSFRNVTVNSTSNIHASTYHSSTSQAHFGYRTQQDFSHPVPPAANIFSGDGLPYDNRFINFSNSQPSQPFLLGCPPPPNHRSAALHQNSPPPWRYYSDPINRAEPSTAPFWPTARQHGTPSSAFHGSFPQQHIVHSATSPARPRNSVSSTFSHPARIVQQASGRTRDAALSSNNSENRTGKAVAGNSNASSSGHYVQKRSGPVKLIPGAKHILVPSDSTGDGSSMPMYSCVSFGSRSGNAAASQNKGA